MYIIPLSIPSEYRKLVSIKPLTLIKLLIFKSKLGPVPIEKKTQE